MMNSFLKMISANRRSSSGFTLIEVLVVLALTGIVMSSVYGIYISTITAASVDEVRVEIQQSQRFSMDFLMRELRHIGYDLAESDQPTLVAGGVDYIYFTADMNGDGDLNDANEHTSFCVYTDAQGRPTLGYLSTNSAANINVANIDADNDGFSDLAHTHPAAGGSHQGLSTIDALEFNYKFSTGGPTTTPTLDGVDLDDVREIDVSLLTRSDNSNSKYDATQLAFQTASGVNWDNFANDGFRRMLLVSTVRLRNMGL